MNPLVGNGALLHCKVTIPWFNGTIVHADTAVRVIDASMNRVLYECHDATVEDGILSYYDDHKEEEVRYACTPPCVDPTADDPATVGVLLAHARVLWEDPNLHTIQVPAIYPEGAEARWGVTGPTTGDLCIADTGIPLREMTETAALLAAIQLLDVECPG